MKGCRIMEVARARMNQLNHYFDQFSEELIKRSLKTCKKFNNLSLLEDELQHRLSFQSHNQRQIEANAQNDKIDELAFAIFDEGIISDEIISTENIKIIESLYPSTSQLLRVKYNIKSTGIKQYLSAVLKVLRLIELSFHDIDENSYSAKTKSHTLELIEQSLGRIALYLK